MVYVDILISCLKNEKWRYSKSCHLFADTVEELQIFAQTIGLKLAWFQKSERFPHFDLTANMRKKAIKNGAKVVSRRFVVKFIKSFEGPGPLFNAKKKKIMKERFVQTQNPITKRYVKLDRLLGIIVRHKSTSGPYKDIPIIKSKEK